MTKIRLTFAVFIGCLLASCSQSDDLFLSEKSNELLLTCFKSDWTGTRAVIDDEGKGNFVEGDCIDMLVASAKTVSSTQLEYASGRWTPSLKRGEYAEDELTLSALFPLLPQAEGDVTKRNVELPTDQSDEKSFASADVLYGKTQVKAGDALATLQFHHALHRININLKGDVPDDLSIEVRTLNKGVISLTDGSVTITGSSEYAWIKPHKKNANAYSVIILPQETSAYRSGEGLLRLTSGGKTVSYLFSEDVEAFNSGMQTTLNLSLKYGESHIDTEFCNQTRWVYGITSPVFPGKDEIVTYPIWEENFEEGIWLRINYNLPDEVNYLTWKEGCGWYDCNKTFDYKDDGSMCWAASASNVIHWWLYHNSKYIEAYEAEYKEEPCPKEYRKMTPSDQQHSEVFNFFKASYPNLGSWDTGAVNWFINGDGRNLIYCYNEDFKGFFHHVFSINDAVAVEKRNVTKENFNLWLKDAFRNHKAIGFYANGFTGLSTRNHSMTIWGAEFDAEGNVAFVYFCDSNDAENEPNHGSVRRFKILYEGDKQQETYIAPLDNNDGTVPKAKAIIGSVVLVDLRQDIWSKKYPNIK